jgi:arabinose-5-phosphate isomerase
MTKSSFIKDAKAVIQCEREALESVEKNLGEAFSDACRSLLECRGKVIVTGMGKSGHIAGKIAATLASTGTPAFFVHPGEASHGDLGMISAQDVVIAISNSGETPEVLTILPMLKRMGVTLIGITGASASSLAQIAQITLDISVEQEACPHNLAPTASTTATLALGDALAVAVLKARNFTEEDFSRSHPGGVLGRRLLVFVEDVMHSGDALPIVKANTSMADAISEMSSKRLGMIGVTDDSGLLVGIFTDGDLRRALSQRVDVHTMAIKEVMTSSPHTIPPSALAAEALQLMQSHSINGLFAVDSTGRPIGALNTLDLIRARII